MAFLEHEGRTIHYRLLGSADKSLLAGWKVLMGRGAASSYALLCEMLGQADFRGAFGGLKPRILDRVGHVPSVESPQQLLPLIEQHLPS